VKNTKISMPICSVVNSILSGSHTTLDALFISAGAPGDPPDLAHHSKWKMWLKQASDDPNTDALSMLGKLIEEFMEVEPIESESTFNSIFGFESETETYKKNKDRLVDILEKDGLSYRKGGIIQEIPKGFGIENLSEALKNKDFHALDVEFGRALENVSKDPASAITAACSILEALFTVYLEKNMIELPTKRSIKPLWSKVQKDLGIDPQSKSDSDIQKILSGLASIVDGVGAFRTHSGSAHGGGKLRYSVQPRHAKLTVSSSHTLALFVIETWEQRNKS
jgi:hypothetical protein